MMIFTVGDVDLKSRLCMKVIETVVLKHDNSAYTTPYINLLF